ncbi:type III secretion system export apparatus subunit SctU [Paraburkholderia sp. CI3]|uniref:type III secretion system export apparatus subunit SctU n=1 Tax=Paraburkholderia sp. CI3 TaxID=2991060 RepID=UPI003D25F29C
MSTEKTEQPTEKKLREAREEGQTAQSKDLTGAVSLMLVLLLAVTGADFLSGKLKQLVQISLDAVSGDHSLAGITRVWLDLAASAVFLLFPFALVALLGAVLALAPQVGLMISMKPVAPKLSAVSPASGIRRIFSLKSLLELVKMLVKAVLLGAVLYEAVLMLMPLIAGAAFQSVNTLIVLSWQSVLRVVGVAALVYLLIGAADLKLQQWLLIRRNRMSKEDIKRENKESEGDPEIKSKRKALARELANSAPTRQAVDSANVVVVNPTHYAVALRYDPAEFGIPRVVAKGVDQRAAEIRAFARDANVPIVGNPPVARALYKVQLNNGIPEELFETVAAILRWVASLSDPDGAPPAGGAPGVLL